MLSIVLLLGTHLCDDDQAFSFPDNVRIFLEQGSSGVLAVDILHRFVVLYVLPFQPT